MISDVYYSRTVIFGWRKVVTVLGLVAEPRELIKWCIIVTVLGLVGGAPGGETPRVADSSAAGAGRGVFGDS